MCDTARSRHLTFCFLTTWRSWGCVTSVKCLFKMREMVFTSDFGTLGISDILSELSCECVAEEEVKEAKEADTNVRVTSG